MLGCVAGYDEAVHSVLLDPFPIEQTRGGFAEYYVSHEVRTAGSQPLATRWPHHHLTPSMAAAALLLAGLCSDKGHGRRPGCPPTPAGTPPTILPVPPPTVSRVTARVGVVGSWCVCVCRAGVHPPHGSKDWMGC